MDAMFSLVIGSSSAKTTRFINKPLLKNITSVVRHAAFIHISRSTLQVLYNPDREHVKSNEMNRKTAVGLPHMR
ncbi:MAG: hypothetical protein SOY13_00975 [Pseudoflavonifractor sp.]|nr:hypothetical protein [Pseudoflavonifractor sp.]